MPLNTLGASLVRKFWVLFVILLMLLAVYVSVGRMVMPRLDSYQPQLEAMLSNALGLEVSAYQLQGGWQGFNPAVTLAQVSLKQPQGKEQPSAQKAVLEIERLMVQLDVVSSLISQQVVFSSFVLEGMTLELQEFESGRWRMAGLPEKPSDSEKTPFDWLLNQSEILLTNISLVLHPFNAEMKTLSIPSWALRCGLMVCASQGSVSWQSDENNELKFSLNIFEKPGDKDFRLEGYLATAPIQITDWLPLAHIENELVNDIQSLLIGGEVWFDWRNEQLQDIRGTLHLPQIELGSGHEAMSAIDFLHTDFSWLRNTGEEGELQALWLNDLTFKYGGEVFEPAKRRVSLLQRGNEQVVRLIADHMSLEPIVNTLLALDSLPEKIRDPLGTLKPSGELHNLQVEYRLPIKGENDQIPWFKVESQLQNVSLSPWQHVPGVGGVSGYLEVQPESGQVDFDSNDFALHFPRVFSDRWQFEKASGAISWIREGKTLWLSGQGLQMSGTVGDVTGSFRSLTSKDGLEPRLSLLIGLENSRLPEALTLLPDVVASPKLVSWLNQAFEKGNVSRTRFVLEQKIKKDANPITRTLAMDVDATSVDFSFHPEWPLLTQGDVSVQIRDQQVAVQSRSAKFFGLALTDIEALYDGTQGAARLTGQTSVSGPLKDAWRVLTDTPLEKNLFALGRDFQFDGEMSKGQLSLDIPFASPDRTDVQLAFTADGAQLKIPTVGVEAKSIRGDFKYSSKQGLTAPEVDAILFGYPAKGIITSKNSSKGVSTELQLRGHLQTPSLSHWLPAGVLKRLHGETDFNVELAVGKGSESRLRIGSALKGVRVDFPAPLYKTAAEATLFSLDLSLLEPQIHELRYGDQFSYALRLADQGYRNGQIRVGNGKADYTAGSDIQVRGYLPLLDYQQWFNVFAQMSQAETKAAKPTDNDRSLLRRIGNIQLDTDVFRFLGKEYQQVAFDATQSQGDWRIEFDSAVAQGGLTYFNDASKPMAVDFNYLYLPDNDAEAKQTLVRPGPAESPEKDALGEVIPQDLPPLDVNIKQLYLVDDPFGRWAFKLRPEPAGASLNALDFELRGVQAKGDLRWLQEGGVHRTEFTGNAIISDIAAMLKAWNKPAAIEGKNANFTGALSWAGSPASFSLLGVQGPVRLKAKQGRIVDMTSIRLLGVLNFNSLSRRLRLDFSDLFQKGFSFDRAEGNLLFDKGQMLMAESLIIDGPSAKFKIDGRTDLVNEQFNQDVIVVLPVTDNIPVIATLAGFPQVGVPIYLFNRAFGEVLDRFTSANYRVTGSWDDPDIKLTSFFDSQNLPQTTEPVKKTGRGKK